MKIIGMMTLLVVLVAPNTLADTPRKDTLTLIPAQTQNNVDRPHNGMTMEAVLKKYGEPKKKHPPVGDPPITRWDYPQFNVYFEYDRVIHAVLNRK